MTCTNKIYFVHLPSTQCTIHYLVEWLTPSDLYQQLVPLPILWLQLKSVLSVTTILAQLIYNISLSQYCQGCNGFISDLDV